jgi:hypothetical protein
MVRLMKLRTGSGDYTRDRHEWLDGITVDDTAKELGIQEDR